MNASGWSHGIGSWRGRVVPLLALIALLCGYTIFPHHALAADLPKTDDPYGDLIVGVPGEDIAGVTDAGAAHVIYGTGLGLQTVDTVQFYQDGTVLPDTPGEDDHFGTAMATGDMTGNGVRDLFVGAPDRDMSATANGVTIAKLGIMYQIHGTGNGWRDKDNLWWSINPRTVGDRDMRYASALAVGDFNHDGYEDLVVGRPGERTLALVDAGGVEVFYGARDGLATGPEGLLIYESSDEIPGDAEALANFGGALATGDFNGDGYDELAIGAPGHSVNGKPGAGRVIVVWGTSRGLNLLYNQEWHQDSGTVGETAEVNDAFGAALTAGDFDGDGYTDLAIGAPDEDLAAAADSGVVHVLYGSGDGLSSVGNQLWFQGTAGFRGVLAANDNFGAALTAGDFNGDGRADLAIGVPGDTPNAVAGAGAVNVLYGENTGLTATNIQTIHQDDPNVQGSGEAGDAFGSALASTDFDADGTDDLAVGVPMEDVNGVVDAGVVQVFYGDLYATVPGLTPLNNQLFFQGDSGLDDTVEADDHFGAALTVMAPMLHHYLPSIRR